MKRRGFLRATTAGTVLGRMARGMGASRLPNVVVILADDLGYGDLGSYGSRIDTPKLDGLARQGAQFRNFYSASPVCSPSRAALMSGRYPNRVDVPRVLGPGDTNGVLRGVKTLPQILKDVGYSTMCVGKWHLGCIPGFLPNDRGFDEFFGVLFSSDMWPRKLMHNTDVVEDAPAIATLTSRWTQASVDAINGWAGPGRPFFLYLAHTAPHVPIDPPDSFRGRSRLGAYADVVQELDWSTGEVLNALAATGVLDNTLVVFTSDNGPWYQGSAGPLSGRKGGTREGGMRMPMLARFPPVIPAGLQVDGIATMMDLLPTISLMTGQAPPPGLDGVDIAPLWNNARSQVDRPPFLFMDNVYAQCIRLGKWKAHFTRYNTDPYGPTPPGGRVNLPLPRPELYNLDLDPAEAFDCASDYGFIVDDLRQRMEQALLEFPDIVQNSWRETMAKQVEDTPSGALPVEKKPAP